MGAFIRRKYCDQACMAMNYDGLIKVLNPHNSRHQSAKVVWGNCENCGGTRLLHVHHVDLNPLNNIPENLRTLCASCHKRLHLQLKRDANPPHSCAYCETPARKRGMCQKHYQRWKKYGDPFLTKRHVIGAPAKFELVRTGLPHTHHSHLHQSSQTESCCCVDLATLSSRKSPRSSSKP